jgi:flagellar basal-body rod protein FlgB
MAHGRSGRKVFAGMGQPLAAAATPALPDGTKYAFGTRLAQYPAMTLSERPDMSDTLFGIHGAALELRSARMGMIASNIANAATPGYKARDIDFAAALNNSVACVDPAEAIDAGTRYRQPVMPSLDGNTVELPTEQLAFGENAVGYAATLSFIRGRVETVTRAIRGE